ncbi:amino acid ABC transporter permease [Pelagibius sp. Alg239-R121]|uniref:amino acid ABC transporter permease n=1 Tax=Pelagibius sp. Alg239-R121 TaxID=2993448 RepID=UPI0024A6CACB|nr:amino acid ABC transporter permease [Pelagibius sp. Alg239-R121]
MTRISSFIDTIWAYLPGMIVAGWLAFQITVLAILLSWVLGLVAALMKTSSHRVVRMPADFYIWFIRGTPSLIQIFIIYFGLPQLGIRLSPFVAGVIAIGLCSGAYVAEVVRGGLLAISKGQWESARAVGMSYALMMRRIILPQVVRVIIPPLTNEAVNTLKNTSLLSAITVMELTLFTQMAIAATFRPFDFYIVAALLYLALTTVLSRFAAWWESKYQIS